MSVLIILLIASLSVSVFFLVAFIWSARHRQFDDEYSSSMRILFEDHPAETADQDSIDFKVADTSTSIFLNSDHASQRLN